MGLYKNIGLYPSFKSIFARVPSLSSDVKAITQNAIIASLTAAGLFCSLLLLTYSWVKIVAIVAIVLPGAGWFLSHGRIRRVLKCVVIAALIFAISFASVEGYLLSNAGYPSGVNLQSTGTGGSFGILDVSLTQLIQGIEKSPTYVLLTAEHGETAPESIKLDSAFSPDLVEVDFYGEGSNAYLAFMAPLPGEQYRVQVGTYSSGLSSLQYVQSLSQQEFAQINAKGLAYYYNTALELVQNRTGNPLKIDSLSLTISVQDEVYLSYEGITVQIVGGYQGQNTLVCGFEPDGKLISMTQPPAT